MNTAEFLSLIMRNFSQNYRHQYRPLKETLLLSICIIIILNFSMAGTRDAFKLKMYKTEEKEERREKENCTVDQFNQIYQKKEGHLSNQNPSKGSSQLEENIEIKSAESSSLMKNPLFLLNLSVLAFLLLIGVEVSLLVIQFIAEKLSLNLFCALITIAIFFHAIVGLSIARLKQKSFHQLQPLVGEDGPKVQFLAQKNDYPTIQNIINCCPSTPQNNCEKTKKLKLPLRLSRFEDQTIKNISNQKKTLQSPSNHDFKVSNHDSLEAKLFLTASLLKNCYQFIMGIVCLTTIEHPNLSNVSYITGIISVGFILILSSSLLAIGLYLLVSKRNSVPEMIQKKNGIILDQNEHIVKESEKEEEKNPVSFSIDNHLQEQKVEEEKIKDEGKEEERKEVEEVENRKNETVELPQEIEKAAEDLFKLKRDKLLLKALKTSRSHFEPSSRDEDFDQKKKVKIDFKNNQVFQYEKSSVNSGKHSVNDSARKSNEKVKSKYVRSKYALPLPHEHIYDASDVFGIVKEKKRSRKSKSAPKARDYLEPAQIIQQVHEKFNRLCS